MIQDLQNNKNTFEDLFEWFLNKLNLFLKNKKLIKLNKSDISFVLIHKLFDFHLKIKDNYTKIYLLYDDEKQQFKY